MVRVRDVMHVLRLRDELDDLPPDREARWGHLMQACCLLFGAVLAASGNGVDFLTGEEHKPRYVDAVEAGSLGFSERQVFYRYLQGDQCVDPCVRKLASIQPKLFTRTRPQLVSDRDWYALDHVNIDRKGARVDAVLYSGFRLDEKGRLRMIAVHRAWGDRAFCERERTILHLLHRAVARPMYAARDPFAEVREKLSPRQMETFKLLMQGLSEKEIASRLGVTRNTAHGYIKEIYRRLNVEGHLELMVKYNLPT
jgi:DNA-binding CsgD family transcriptional regulator